MKKSPFIVVAAILLFSGSCKTSLEGTRTADIQKIPSDLKWSERMALSILKRNPTMEQPTNGSWGYTVGLIYYAFQKLADKTKDTRYKKAIDAYAQHMISGDGTIRGFNKADYNLDNINTGKILFQLYRQTSEQKYKLAMDKLRDQLKDQPRTSEGGYWHKQRYPWQMWLDGAYMASPFLAQYAKEFNESKSFDEVALQFLLMEKHLKDSKTGLFYHGWDEKRQQLWADKTTGRSPNFWGRAIGWYSMALVDALDYFQADHPKQKELVRILQALAPALQKSQDPNTGLWYQVMDQGTRKGNYLEASASAMFVYALAKGVRKGYLGRDFLKVAQKGYEGILNNLIKVSENGEVSLMQVCEVAGLSADRNGSFEYYVNEKITPNDPKGTAPFIFASLELNK